VNHPSLPPAQELWTFVRAVLKNRFSTALSEEEAQDLQGAIFEWWCECGAERFLQDEVRSWRAWVGRVTGNRALDFIRARSRHRRILRSLGASSGPPPGAADEDSDGAEVRYLKREGQVGDPGFDDPVEAREWGEAQQIAWEQLAEKDRVVLRTWARERLGELPDKAAAAAEATEQLGLRAPLSYNAFSIRVTRAREQLYELLGKHDISWDLEFEKILVARQGKRLLPACVNRKEAPGGLDSAERAVFSVAIEVGLRRRSSASALGEAALRSGGAPLQAAAYDALLASARAKLVAVAGGELLDERALFEYLAKRWAAVKEAAPPSGGGEAARPPLRLVQGGRTAPGTGKD